MISIQDPERKGSFKEGGENQKMDEKYGSKSSNMEEKN